MTEQRGAWKANPGQGAYVRKEADDPDTPEITVHEWHRSLAVVWEHFRKTNAAGGHSVIVRGSDEDPVWRVTLQDDKARGYQGLFVEAQ
ncbi:hypothetical protein [Candidatus Palauibacter sp.]|uniref:hypothetical protein n=1 Tax=Candidatus Palauibacter sp. TaxID=3101350 RepID=UPI003C706187